MNANRNSGAVAAAIVIALAALTAAPLRAQTAKSQMTVGVQPPPPPPRWRRPGYYHPYYYPYLPLTPRKKRCEQDRLLTDTTPCGDATEAPPAGPPQ